MIAADNEQAIMRNHLLGELDEPLREEVEERIVCDSEFAERLAIEEHNLIDDYVFEGLSESERESFHKNFLLDDERRHRLKIARALEVYVAEDEKQQLPTAREPWLVADPWREALRFLQRSKVWATVAVTAILLLTFLAPTITRWIWPKAGAPVDDNRVRIEHQLAELNSLPLVVTDQLSTELVLQPTRLRADGELKKVVLENKKFVKLQLEFPSPTNYSNYRVLVRTVEGPELFAINDVKSQSNQKALVLRIPSELLSTGDYQIELQGITPNEPSAIIANYDFRIANNNIR